MTKLIKITSMAALVAISLTGVTATSATAEENITPWASNSSAQKTQDYWNNELKDLTIHNNELYSGYGNYGADIGPIDLISHNLSTATETKHITVPTEDIDRLKLINGNLYAPYIDGRVAWTSDVGYATNESGSWENKDVTPFIHTFDIASTGDDLWLSGSIVNPDKALYGSSNHLAAIKRSVDGGATWTIEKIRSSDANGDNDFDRNYWLASVNGKIYSNATTNLSENTLDVWENGTWSEVKLDHKVGINRAQHVEVINDTIVATNIGQMFTYNTETGEELSTAGKYILDMYLANDRLYALVTNSSEGIQELISTQDGETWKAHEILDSKNIPLKTVTDRNGTNQVQTVLTTLAVEGDNVYYGASTGDIYKESLKDLNQPEFKRAIAININPTTGTGSMNLDEFKKLKTPQVTAKANDGKTISNLVKITTKTTLKGTFVTYTVKYKNTTETLSRVVNMNNGTIMD